MESRFLVIIKVCGDCGPFQAVLHDYSATMQFPFVFAFFCGMIPRSTFLSCPTSMFSRMAVLDWVCLSTLFSVDTFFERRDLVPFQTLIGERNSR